MADDPAHEACVEQDVVHDQNYLSDATMRGANVLLALPVCTLSVSRGVRVVGRGSGAAAALIALNTYPSHATRSCPCLSGAPRDLLLAVCNKICNPVQKVSLRITHVS